MADRLASQTGFNSATALKPWMIPARGRAAARPGRFNSATALKPWMTAPVWVAATKGAVLQFGHGVDAVDDYCQAWQRNAAATLQFGHGVEAVENPRIRAGGQTQLQFGHGVDAVDESAT